MQRILLTSLLIVGGLASCAPRNQSTVAGVTQAPVLIKVSEAASLGGSMTIQGRYLGGPDTAYVLMGANADGKGGYKVPKDSIKSWSDTEIVLNIPQNAPVGGSWLYVVVGGMPSANGLPISVKQ